MISVKLDIENSALIQESEDLSQEKQFCIETSYN